MLRGSIAAVILLLASPTHAQDKPGTIEVRDGMPFRHDHSGFAFPTELIGLKRAPGTELVKPQLDLFFSYRAPDEAEEVSVYLYRVKSGSPSQWFDVSRLTVQDREAYGRKTPLSEPVTFVPPGQSRPSALRIAWTLSEGPFRSTVLALIPMGEWLVKIRHTAKSIEAASLQRRTEAAIAALGWPEQIVPAADAVPVATCTDALALKGSSKPARTNGAGTLLDAMMAQMEGGGAAKKDERLTPEEGASPVQWCRDDAVKSPLRLYRPVGTRDTYLMAASDAGLAIWVRPGMSGLLDKENAARTWAVSVVRAGDTINYAPRDRLPLPTEIGKILEGNATSRVSTWGKATINIDAERLK
ncbi:hypothetical protein FPZ54_12175 [Sphingomonas suaedae]|uniref:Uncharacterized protein n=1 Tax=Sphingomonas suaedae TaxID=2599297 RepID=A0A518RGZ0_9SPHN|nr:hypothetical protein [Sphingomonas suaedae]QDX26691.1 hypothetical protein FPZ54_12175 [Sphingomonas suaedae]